MGIIIKRQAGKGAAPQSLKYGEFAVNKAGGVYVGNESEGTVYCSNIIEGGGLLDNPQFLINQRGQNVYTTTPTTEINCVDRWRLGLSTSFNVATKTLTTTAYNIDWNQFVQIMLLSEKGVLVGDTLTVSYLINDKYISVTGIVLDRTKYGSYDTIPYAYEDNDLKIKIFGKQYENLLYLSFIPKKPLVIKWVKLEKGEFATPFIPKGYGAELLECKRYYQVLPVTFFSMPQGYAVFSGRDFPVQMRTAPNVIVVDEMGNEGYIGAYGISKYSKVILSPASSMGLKYLGGETASGAHVLYCYGLKLSADL